MKRIVVVGGGQAGASLVAKLRNLGFDGQIVLIGEERDPPYQRPPLSKKYLLGELERERLYLRPKTFYADHDVELVLGKRCERIVLSKSEVLVEGDPVRFDELVLATGSIPRRLPASIGGNLAGVHTVRTIEDIDRLSEEFSEGKRVMVIGGGYIGLEVASAAVGRGLEVVLVEAAERILQRVAAEETSTFMGNLHRKNGVELLEGASLASLVGTDRVESALLGDGRAIPVDLAVVGIGIEPSVDLAKTAGLELNNGIKVDFKGRSSVSNIWAAGDCTSFPWQDRRIRLESVQNAIDQAELVAENILGADKDYIPTPWFWSDQYDAKLQIAGLGSGYDEIVTRKGATNSSISFWYMKAGSLLAVDAVNDSRSYMVGKRLLEIGKNVTSDQLRDPKTNLKALLRAR